MAEAALQRASQAVPDIILLDALMPGMDGFEVARRLKAQGENQPYSHCVHDGIDGDRARGQCLRCRRH